MCMNADLSSQLLFKSLYNETGGALKDFLNKIKS